jgi:hypothetical protein
MTRVRCGTVANKTTLTVVPLPGSGEVLCSLETGTFLGLKAFTHMQAGPKQATSD